MFFWNSLAFLMIQQMLAIWSLVPLAFLNPAWTSGSSRFTYCWSLVWKIQISSRYQFHVFLWPACMGQTSLTSRISKLEINLFILLSDSDYFSSVWNECDCTVVWAFFGIAFLWDWNENWPFPVLWPLLSFPKIFFFFEFSKFAGILSAALSQHQFLFIRFHI